ncbi:Rne/Rng family ribonuclease [Sedimentibacter sp. zth1]|uniref:Rne/Rng family ribonuclease n=1 Tax=Sedimentibacter sp. zth1 TaxID=2816908 RepID=UPI001A912AC0|nr:Rne/Rng family ribonuclease [Sedimentibacter sp. zth1]QSX06418.1 Rne/Rng family ribonuclease [Sedimentibacter sp. zth1]
MRQLIISSSFSYEKVAILEDGKLEEFFYENKNNQNSYLGNIYLGKVVDILPGMQAAFIDIGLEKNAYLYIDELLSKKTIVEKNLVKEQISNISQILKKGEEILVQVVRDPIGEKNISLTTDISLAGKCIAIIPKNKEVSVSKRIREKVEKKRLYLIGKEIMVDDCGIIFRTFSKGLNQTNLEEEYRNLVEEYKKIEKQALYSMAPKLLKRHNSLLEMVFVDYINNNIDEIYVENSDDKKAVISFLKKYKEYNNESIKVSDTYSNLFETFNIEKQIDILNNRKVKLENGGDIVIDTTEALTVIDVNSGSFIGKNEQDETSLIINISAMEEIARQIKLRNISGIIIVDFIDFRKKDYTNILIAKAKQYLQNDKTRTKVLGMTKLNLMEITRKRNKENFYNSMNEECYICEGNGKLPSGLQIMLKIENILKKISSNTSSNIVYLECSSHIYRKATTELIEEIKMLERTSCIEIHLVKNNDAAGNIIAVKKMGKKGSI